MVLYMYMLMGMHIQGACTTGIIIPHRLTLAMPGWLWVVRLSAGDESQSVFLLLLTAVVIRIPNLV